MKIKKSILSMVLIVSLAITSFVPSLVFAESLDYSAAVGNLQRLGAIDSSISDVNSQLTRAQMAKIIISVNDLTDEAATLSGSTVFPDIVSGSEFSGYVNSLRNRGLMTGMLDGKFHPEAGVTYAEACITLVKLLGYTDSDVTGAWPINYISKATDLKLTNGITLKKNDKVTIGTAALMFNRLFDTNMKKANASEASKTFSEYVGLYTDSITIFAYDESSKGYEYAVITNPVYSKPEIATKFDPNAYSIGEITFDGSTKIVKNGKIISKSDIEEMDVVYSVTDGKGSNKYIFVYNDRAEGIINGFTSSGPNTINIQIDKDTYSFSKEMDLSTISELKTDDKVSGLLGYDGKIVALRKIDYKTRNEVKVKILGNAKTSSTLMNNQVITDSGNYFVLNSVKNLEVGGEYTVIVDDDIIVKVQEKENSLEKYGVRKILDNVISCTKEEGSASIVLPEIAIYYYNGQKVDRKTAMDNLKIGSSIILAKNSDKNEYGGYEYGVVVDPIYSEPVIMSSENMSKLEKMYAGGFLFLYRDGEYYEATDSVIDGDVVYTVSDLWNKNKYIYVYNETVSGTITKILPNRINPKSIDVDGINYSFSKYFNVYKINGFNVDSGVDLILDIEGKILDMKTY